MYVATVYAYKLFARAFRSPCVVCGLSFKFLKTLACSLWYVGYH